MKESYNWLRGIQEGKGKEIARAYFITYNTQHNISKLIYPETHKQIAKNNLKNAFVQPTIKRKFREWKKLKFFDLSIPLKVKVFKKGRYQYQPFRYSILNFEPIYKFCKEKGIEFSEEEKRTPTFIFDLKDERLRIEILRQYPKEDIINAILKFYVKNFIMKYSYYLRDIREHREAYKRFEDKKNELNNPRTEQGKMMKEASDRLGKELSKKYHQPYIKTEFDIMKLVAMELSHQAFNNLYSFLKKHKIERRNISKNPEIIKNLTMKEKETLDYLERNNYIQRSFHSYLIQVEKNPEIIKSIDKKILSALDILPFTPPLN